MKGYVYILTNPAFYDDWVKIGQTEDINRRIKVLSNKTCLPYGFDLYAYCQTSKYKELEKQIHRLLDKYAKLRITPNREFFRIPPSQALRELRFLASTIDDAEFYAPGENKNITVHSTPAPPFHFSMVHIVPGTELIFEPTGARVIVIDDKRIEYEGQKYTLSGFCKAYMPDKKRNKADAYQGPLYFSYDDKLRCNLRKEYENKES